MPDPELTLDAIFVRAIELRTPDARAAYLDGACGGDDGLRRQVESLVAAHFLAGSFLDPPQPTSESTVAWTAPDATGTTIGPYKLLEKIGEGGMGIVYVAEQTAPMKRRVALKVIKPGMDTKEVVARFEAERQALALMDHPNIARVFDGGVHDGRPYFVMELVRGLPITAYCDRANLPTRDRLALFATVCRAVQHAHQKGVIHRDLKPSNVLVTLHDGTPVPKVIDFGVAKAVNQPLTEKSVYTRFAQMIGTPLYMAPEQAELSGLDVDTRADVYSLGVLLYELLTGTTPFDGNTLRQAGLDEMRRIIREVEPPPPSQRVSTLGEPERSGVSGRRGLDERRLSRLLRGDLDWVAMRALEKDRNRRYDSAGAFAADVERYLSDEPVEARPPSVWYTMRKAARRNRPLLITAGLVAAALLVGTAVSVWQAIRATEAQRQAEADRDHAEASERNAATEAAIAKAVNDFLQEDLLRQAAGELPADREFGGSPYLTVKEALDRAAARIGERFQDQPLVEAAIRTAIGEAYHSLLANGPAVPHLERALTLRKKLFGPDHPDTLASMSSLASLYSWTGRHSEAISLRQQVLESRTAALGPDHPVTRSSVGSLAVANEFAGQFDTSSRLLEQLIEKSVHSLGPTHPETLGAMRRLAWNYGLMGRLPESTALFEKILALRKSMGDSDLALTSLLQHYAQVCQWGGKHDQAERLIREGIEHLRKRPDSPDRRREAANAHGWLAANLLLQQRYDEAEPIARQALAEDHLPGNPKQSYWVCVLGAVLLGQKKYDEAEPLLLQGYEGSNQYEAIHPAVRRRQKEAGQWIIRLYEATNQPEKARSWREKLSAPAKHGR